MSRPARGGLAAAWSTDPAAALRALLPGRPQLRSAASSSGRSLRWTSSAPRSAATSEVLGNIEYIVPLPFNFRVAAFFDVGNVYGLHRTPFDLTDLRVRRRARHSVAVALRADPGRLWRQPRSPRRVRRSARSSSRWARLSEEGCDEALGECSGGGHCPDRVLPRVLGPRPRRRLRLRPRPPRRRRANGLQRIAYIDVQRVLARSAAGVAAREQLERDKAAMQKEMDGKRAELEKLRDELEKKGALLTPDARPREAGAVRAQARATPPGWLTTSRRSWRRRSRSAPEGPAGRLGRDRAGGQGEELLSRSSRSAARGVLYGSTEADLTEEIIRQFDARLPSKARRSRSDHGQAGFTLGELAEVLQAPRSMVIRAASSPGWRRWRAPGPSRSRSSPISATAARRTRHARAPSWCRATSRDCPAPTLGCDAPQQALIAAAAAVSPAGAHARRASIARRWWRRRRRDRSERLGGAAVRGGEPAR